MPIYEYQCTSCGHRFEFFRSIKDAPLSICPNCQGALRKLLSPAGLIFKGAGWYKTDSRTTPSEKTSNEQAPTNGDKKGDAGASDTAKPSADSASTTSGEPSNPSKPNESKASSGAKAAD